MSEEAAFLAAIAEQPGDDVTRLVYADWLEEHGEGDRAAFIRAQCQLTTLADGDSTREPVVARVEELNVRHRADWEQPLRELGAVGVTFRRGFVDGITISAANFLNHADALFAEAPTLRCLKVTCRADGAGNHFVMQPNCHLSRYESVEALTEYLHQATGWHAEVYDPDELKQGVDLVDGDAMRFLASCPHLLKIEELDLSDNNFGVSVNGFSSRGADAIGGSPYLANVSRLDVSRTPIDYVVLSALRGPHSRNLRVLEMRACGVTTDQATRLQTTPYYPNLELLDLRDNQIEEHYSLRGFAQDSKLPKLRMILLDGNPIGQALRRELERDIAQKGQSAQIDWLQPG